MADSANYDIDYSRLSPYMLEHLLKKRLLALAIITDDLMTNEVKRKKALQRIDESGKTVFPNTAYWKEDPAARQSEKDVGIIFQHINIGNSEEFDKDMQKRAEQILQIMLEMGKRRIPTPHIDLTKIHPRIAKAFWQETEKIGWHVKAPKVKKIPKITPRRK